MFLAPFSGRAFGRAATVFALLAASLASVFGQAPAADGFAPDVDGNVFAVATQSDGKIVVGGQFTSINSSSRQNLARLNPDGSVDASFNPTANGPVRAIVIQPDGQIVIGGDFTSLQPGGSGAVVARNRAARLNANGTVEGRFNPNLGGDRQPQVHALLLQPDGRILVGGSFTTAQPGGTGASVTRQRLARFNADGTLDTGFNPGANNMVLALALHTDGRILVGGGFTTIQGAGRNRIARLNRDGSVDSSFDANANNAVTAIAVQRDGRILLGGQFTTLHPIGDENPSARARLGRLLADGTLDYDFVATVNGPVAKIALQSDGGILVGGTFNSAWGRGGASSARNNIARFTPDGSLAADFNPNVNAQVAAIAFQPDGKIVLGGYFTRVQPRGASSGLVRNRLARLNADGSLDTSFVLDAGGRVLASAVQSDGRILVGGSFRSVGGLTRNYFARLNADGSVDPAYNPDFNDRVYTIAVQSDGKAVVGGAFTTAGGETRNHIARLNTDGSVDSSFTPSIDGTVGAILVQSDGRILVGGTFTTVIGVGDTSSTLRTNLLRLNANGSLDTGFNPGPNSAVAAMALQSDGKIVLGGNFSVLTPGSGGQTARNFIARINSDGTIDSAFAPAVNGRVSALVVQPDGKIVVAGAFTGVVSSGANESVVRNRIARFNADGTLDAAYNPNANDNVLALALQSDGKLIIGGAFTTLQPNDSPDWTLRKYVARLDTNGGVDATFNLDLNEATGNRVDSLRLQSDGRLLIGGSFASLHPVGTPARIERSTFARVNPANGTVDTAFTLGAAASTRGQIRALALQPDNKIIAVGAFSNLGGTRTTNIARFNPEGAADPAFGQTVAANGTVRAVALRPEAAATPSQAPGFAWLNRNGTLRSFNVRGASRLSGSIHVAAVQSNGGVLLGGAFTNLANTTGGNLVRLNADGSLDTNFNPAPNGAVTAIAIQPDGRTVIVGTFSLVHGAVRNRIARLNADGSLDSGFDPNASGAINAVVVESDGRMIVGGAFTSFLPNATTTSVARNFLARINGDGTVDANYNPNPNAIVYALALQGDGKVVVGGGFTALQPAASTTATTRNGVARVNADGTIDTGFDPNFNGTVVALAVQPNGQVIAGGQFTTVGGGSAPYLARNNIGRVNSDGIGDANFNPNVNGVVRAIAVQPDGGVLLGGDFTTVEANGAASVARTGLVRVASSGALDVDFDPDLNGSVLGVTARPDGTVIVTGNFTGLQLSGSIIIGGDFSTVGGLPRRNLAALTSDGGVSTAFQPNPNGAINALLAQPDGKLLVGGEFTNIGGAARNRLARFNADGTLDAAFTPSLAGAVNALALQADGRVLVGGAFGESAGVVRLNADGSADASFTTTAASPVTALAVVQSSGRIFYVTNRSTLRRLNPNGTVDATGIPFMEGTDRFLTLAIDSEGGVIVGGSGVVSQIGGGTSGPANVARIHGDGSYDSSFAPNPNGAVTAIAIQSDGRAVIGGSFSTVGGQQRFGVARVAAPGPAVDLLAISADGRTVRWVRSGSAAEIAGVSFELSTDRATWTSLGRGTRTEEGWSLGGVSLPSSGVFYLRARAIAPSSGGTSSGVFEVTREFNLAAGAAPAGETIAAGGFAFDPYSGILYGSPASTTPAPAGAASVITGGGDTIEIVAANLQPGSGLGQLANLSTRARVTADNPLILGFAIAGSEPRTLLMRAVGPTLAGFGVADALSGTRLQIHDSSGAVVVANEGWTGAADVVQVAARSGAFPLATGSADSAAVVTLAPGVYTMQIVDTRGTGGVALAEIYDADSRTGSRLVNVSSRAEAGLGGDALISGFVVAGDAPKRVLLRAVGPTLAEFGAPNVVADPSIALYNSAGVALGTNDNWVAVSQVITAATSAGAFPLAAGSKDAAVIATLPPGAYTIQVTGRDGSTGAALLEVYELPY